METTNTIRRIQTLMSPPLEPNSRMSTHIIGFARLQLGHLMEAISPVATAADLGSRPLSVIMPHTGIRIRVTSYRGTLVGGN